MKYLPLADFDVVTNALNFSTPDLHVIGGCDVYTTKAAGRDKKLYKDIDNSLEAQYQNLVRLSASLSPPVRTAKSDDGKGSRKKRSGTAEPPEINLSRESPFGSLSKISARRTFAYLIATLNASHPDYEFSNHTRPRDFKHERSLKAVMHNIDSTLHNLRPRFSTPYLSPPLLSSSTSITNSLGNEVWSPRMWSMIDKEMELPQCEKYSYSPDYDPFDGEDGSIWSMHYFFFNKERKRVCYLYLRGVSVISHSPVTVPIVRKSKPSSSSLGVGEGAGKRASYWLGNDHEAEPYGCEDDDDEMVISGPDDDEVDVPYMDLDEIRTDLQYGSYQYQYYGEDDEVDCDGNVWPSEDRSHVRGMSEEIGDAMEM